MLTKLPGNLRRAYSDTDVPSRVNALSTRLDQHAAHREEGSKHDHAETVRSYYELCSEFMQIGWNQSLHFAPLRPGETLENAILRHQLLMIQKLELCEGMRVLDVGCGVGGPMRRVAGETGVHVVCLNHNKQQLDKARQLNAEAGLNHLAEYAQCDFMDMSLFEDNTFDAAYAIESTCHAPDKQGAFAEIYRVLKPGAPFWGQEMCLTEKFNSASPEHLNIKKELMRGIALNEIATFSQVNDALEAVGFEVEETLNRATQENPSIPWYKPMEGGVRGSRGNAIRNFPQGVNITLVGLRLAELVKLFPKGSADVISLMNRTAKAYVAGGKTGIFTPLYCFLAHKPG